eukprot:TRINITY_DN11745_c0_g1_i1.p1 TRINITY_DN11745_c0_g1~~TRINITY_DN11745_c0_g1_i1.p1  ORF type:complete len:732 (+),score=146.45 TRINITY_DN11745_c0_g1_i1:914-3109(+)
MGQKHSYVSKPIFSESKGSNKVPKAHKALLVGVSYRGKKDAELKGSPVDVRNMQHLLESQGFQTKENTRILLEDSNEDPPTKQNIIRGVEWLSEGSSPGDVLVLYLVGNGGDISKLTNNKLKHQSDVLLPMDFNNTIESAVLGNEIYHAASLNHGVKLVIIRDFTLPGSLLPLPFTHSWSGGKYDIREDSKLADFIDKDVEVFSVTSPKPQRLAAGMLTTALVEGFNSLSSKQSNFTHSDLLRVVSAKYKSLLKGTHSTPAIYYHTKLADSDPFTWQCADTQRGLAIPVGSQVTLYNLKEKGLNGLTGIMSERFTGGIAGVDIPGRDTPVNVLSKNLKLADATHLSLPPGGGVGGGTSKSSMSSMSDVGIVNDEILADTKISRAANDNSNWVVTVRKEPEAPLGLQLAHNLVLLGTDPNTPASESGVPHSIGRTLVSINNNPVYNHEDVLRETIGRDICTLEFSERQATDIKTHSSVPNSTLIPPGTPTSDPGYYVAPGFSTASPASHRTGYGRGRGRVVSGPSYDFPGGMASPSRLAPPQPPHPFIHNSIPVGVTSPPVTSAAFNERMESLQQQKQIAVASENYIEAKQLKAEIDRLTAEAAAVEGGGGLRLPVVPLAERVVSLERRLADTEAALAHRELELDRMRSSSPPAPPAPPSRVSYSRPSVVPTYSPQQLPAPPPMVPMARIQSLSPHNSYRAGQRVSISPPRPVRGEPYQQKVVPLVANQQLF